MNPVLWFLIGVGCGMVSGLPMGMGFTSLRLGARSRAGHVSHTILELQGVWSIASCECGYTERCASRDAAEGALQGHLRTARPWEHYAGRTPCPGPGDDTHRVLTLDEAATVVAPGEQPVSF